MAHTLGQELVDLLAERRTRLNGLFEQARIALPALDQKAFAHHLRETVLPAVEAVLRLDGSRAPLVLERLYALSLKLVGGGIVGPLARLPSVDVGWRRLLIDQPRWLAAEPDRVPAALANALNHLGSRGEASVDRWVRLMSVAGDQTQSADEFLMSGQLAAWRAGLPEYRESALLVAEELRPALGASILELGSVPDELHYQALIGRLGDCPWALPQDLAAQHPRLTLRLVGIEGGFRGFGGPFRAPPSLACVDEQLYGSDGHSVFAIHADRCGIRYVPAVWPSKIGHGREPGRFTLDAGGHVRSVNGQWRIPELVGTTSYASNSTTLVVGRPDSLYVMFLGLIADE